MFNASCMELWSIWEQNMCVQMGNAEFLVILYQFLLLNRLMAAKKKK